VPVGLFGLATNTTRVRSLHGREIVAERHRGIFGQRVDDHARGAGRLHRVGIHGEGIPRVDGFQSGLEERLGQQHEQVVGTVAERDLRDVDTELRGELVLELVAAAVGIEPGVGERRVHRGECVGAGTEGVFVRRELDDAADAELAFELFDGFAGDVRRERADVFDRQVTGIKWGHS